MTATTYKLIIVGLLVCWGVEVYLHNPLNTFLAACRTTGKAERLVKSSTADTLYITCNKLTGE